MVYLLISIVFSVSVSILLKMARKKNRHRAGGRRQLCGRGHTDPVGIEAGCRQYRCIFADVVLLFAALGVLLPSVFVIMGKSVESAGIVKSDAAQRLSLFLPIVAALTLFGENSVKAN